MKSLFVFVLAIAAVGAQPKMTKAEHMSEAQRHATRADEHAAKAEKHEAAAARIRANRGYNAMQYKWPAMALGAENAERDRAAEARRKEAAARELVARHTQLAEQAVVAEP